MRVRFDAHLELKKFACEDDELNYLQSVELRASHTFSDAVKVRALLRK